MMLILRVLLVALVCAPLVSIESEAQDINGKQVAQRSSQIQELKDQIDEIQRQNQQQIQELQRKIEQLETNRAADQEKISKLAEEEADAWYKKLKAAYDKGFVLKSEDGNFSMKFRLRTQFQFSVTDTDEEGELVATNFDIRRLRLIWNGNAFTPWFQYYIQASADQNGNFILRDAYFDAAYNKQIFPRAGQNKVPFNREELNSSSELQLVERSIVNNQFSYGRDRGVGLYGLLGNLVTYGAGVYNGDGRNGTSVDSNLLYAGRIQFNVCCGKQEYANSQFPLKGDYKIEPNFGEDYPLLAIGASIATIPGLNIDRKTPDSDIDERYTELGLTSGDVTSVTADINFKYKIFSVEGEYDGRWIDPDQTGFAGRIYDQGFRIQGGIFLIPKTIEVAGRWAYIDFDNVGTLNPEEDPTTTMWELTPGLNYYMSHDHRWKIQFSYSYIRNEFTVGQNINDQIWRLQLQSYF